MQEELHCLGKDITLNTSALINVKDFDYKYSGAQSYI